MHNAIKGWHFLRDGEQPSGCRETFEEAMLKYYNEISLNGYITPQIQAPGSNMKHQKAGMYWEKCLDIWYSAER